MEMFATCTLKITLTPIMNKFAIDLNITPTSLHAKKCALKSLLDDNMPLFLRIWRC